MSVSGPIYTSLVSGADSSGPVQSQSQAPLSELAGRATGEATSALVYTPSPSMPGLGLGLGFVASTAVLDPDDADDALQSLQEPSSAKLVDLEQGSDTSAPVKPTTREIVRPVRETEDLARIGVVFASAKDRYRNELLARTELTHERSFCKNLAPGTDPVTEQAKMRAFLNSGEFDRFYASLTECFIYMVDEDGFSIANGAPTEIARQYLECLDILDRNGFHNIRGRQINFWSGIKAKAQAFADTSLSDSQVSAISAIVDFHKLIAEIEEPKAVKYFPSIIGSIASASFATQARGRVKLFISPDKLSEEASYTAGNFHWKSEMPLIQTMLQRGAIEGYEIYRLRRQYRSGCLSTLLNWWKGPLEVWEGPINFHEHGDDLPIVRFSAYAPADRRDLHDEREPFYHGPFGAGFAAAYKVHCGSAPARPTLTIGRLRDLGRCWKRKAKEKKEARIAAHADSLRQKQVTKVEVPS